MCDKSFTMNVQCLIFLVVLNACCNVYGNVDQVNNFKTANGNLESVSYSAETSDAESKLVSIIVAEE